MSKVFDNSSFFINQGQKNQYSYVTLKSASGQSYFGKAPMLSIQVSQSTDASLHKSLDGAFHVTVFPDNPAIITIGGITSLITSNNTDCPSPEEDNTIEAFYDQYKVSSENEGLLTLTIGTTTYKAILLGIQRESLDQPQFPGLIMYRLTLRGKKQ